MRASPSRRVRGLVVALLAMPIAVSCSEAEPPHEVAPARVENAVPESQLARVTLLPQAEQRLGVRTATVERRQVERSRSYPAVALVRPKRDARVDAAFAGTVLGPAKAEIPAVGESVVAGQAILRLVPLRPGEGDVQVDAQRDLVTAGARLAAARAAAERTQQLLRDRAASARDAELAEKDLAIAKAELAAARSHVSRISNTPLSGGGGLALSAPHAGILQGLHVSEGQTVSAGTALFDVADLDPVWVRVAVYAGDAPGIRPDRSARVHRLSSAGEGREALPVSAPLSAEPRSASVDLYYELENPEPRIRPGERLSVRVMLKGERESLVVPWSSILYDAYGGSWVYVSPEPQVYERSRVDVREVVGSLALLSRGPEPGSSVVTEGAAEIFGTEFGVGGGH